MTDDESNEYAERLFAGEIEPLPEVLPEGAEEAIAAWLDRYLVSPLDDPEAKRVKPEKR